jgi:hypothetical protein
MNRRGFLQLLTGGIAAIAAEQVIPLGRVWSFPSKIIIPKPLVIPTRSGFVLDEIKRVSLSHLATIYYDRKALDALKNNYIIDEILKEKKLPRRADGPIQLLSFAGEF